MKAILATILTFLCLVWAAGAFSKSAVLEGEWQGRVSLHEGDTVQVVMDLGKIGSRWVGSYSVEQFGLKDYPIEVSADRDSVRLFFTSPGVRFAGKLEPETLSGWLNHDGPVPMTFHRTGEAKFSETFMRVEHAEDDPSLIEVLPADASALRDRFNADKKKTRLVMLLSPTCPACRNGAQVVQDSVLEKIDSKDLAVYAVWEPILKTDDERASRRATVLLPDDRVKEYWAETIDVGKMFQPVVGLEKEPAWDVYLVYQPGAVWEGATPPAPAEFMHQLWARLPAEKALDGGKLRAALEKDHR